MEDMGLIGNCQFSALVDTTGSVAWCCMPRFDSEPVFAGLLDAGRGGRFGIGPVDGSPGKQRYLDNTNVLETRFDTPEGSFRVLDFAPRFELHDRHFHPTQLVRIVEPLDGSPRLRVQCEPILGWSRAAPTHVPGSNHVRFDGYAAQLRLTTDVPLSYLAGLPFTLSTRKHLVLSWGAPVEEPLQSLCERFLSQTVRYWQRWVKQCDIPPHYQREVIRSALVLKLHCFEDTGAIVAATTTSLPEAPGSGRTWDYRYCWLRDAFYALNAFRLLGHFEERERFVHFLLDIAGSTRELELSPLYRVDGRSNLDERVLEEWPGYEGNRPVRIGNAAAHHTQNDIFGEMVLALTPIFLDERFSDDRTPATLGLIERLARKAVSVAGAPDAGIWELRREWRPQTFSSLMSWAAAERMARVAALHAPGLRAEFDAAAQRLHAEVLERSWSPNLGGFVATYDGQDFDASLLQMASLRFLPPSDARLRSSVDAISKGLSRSGWIFRYSSDDGLGRPAVAFVLCTFWLVEALVVLGRIEEARQLMQQVQATLTPLGLISEDYEPASRRMWGNFPQAYSHVGMIHAAFAASPRWSDVQ
jgi:GH15 family glucan-1,4-alpha-glucosidase